MPRGCRTPQMSKRQGTMTAVDSQQRQRGSIASELGMVSDLDEMEQDGNRLRRRHVTMDPRRTREPEACGDVAAGVLSSPSAFRILGLVVVLSGQEKKNVNALPKEQHSVVVVVQAVRRQAGCAWQRLT